MKEMTTPTDKPEDVRIMYAMAIDGSEKSFSVKRSPDDFGMDNILAPAFPVAVFTGEELEAYETKGKAEGARAERARIRASVRLWISDHFSHDMSDDLIEEFEELFK